jgi:chemotaxis family two-component system sensor histidine kinase/response regulator PixL
LFTINKNNSYGIINHNAKIMVIGDDFDISTLVKITLQKNGFEDVFVFTRPSLALEHFKINHKDYSLVICDIRMPEMNGFEFAKYISQVKPGIKVLLMTAFDTKDDDLVAMNMKYNNLSGVIQKPVSSSKLASMIITQINK